MPLFGLPDTARLAKLLLRDRRNLWLLRGPLGSGKTTLVRAVARCLGVRRPVASPTFALVQTFALHHPQYRLLVHVDSYRVRRASEWPALGLDEYLNNPAVLMIIEWPEKLHRRWIGALRLQLKHVPDGRVASWR